MLRELGKLGLSFWDLETPMERLTWVWSDAHKLELSTGYDYYENLKERIKQIGVECGYGHGAYRGDISPLAAAFAALSPNNNEQSNIMALRYMCLNIKYGSRHRSSDPYTVSAYGHAREKARDILLTGDASLLSGQKVRPFYHNVMNCQNSDYVTIDGHMRNLLDGRVRGLKTVPDMTRKEYDGLGDKIREFARTHVVINSPPGGDWSAPRVQATLWLIWRRLIKPYFKNSTRSGVELTRCPPTLERVSATTIL